MRQEHESQPEYRTRRFDIWERLPVLLPRRRITSLRPLQRKGWQYGAYHFPECLLWGLDHPART